MSRRKPWRDWFYSPCYSCICETCVYNAATGKHWSHMYKHNRNEIPAEDDFCYRCEDVCVEYDGAPDKHKGVLTVCGKYKKASWYTEQEMKAMEEEADKRRKGFIVLGGSDNTKEAENYGE